MARHLTLSMVLRNSVLSRNSALMHFVSFLEVSAISTAALTFMFGCAFVNDKSELVTSAGHLANCF
jgi:hypothetical protein